MAVGSISLVAPRHTFRLAAFQEDQNQMPPLYSELKSNRIASKLLKNRFKYGARGDGFIDCAGVIKEVIKAYGVDVSVASDVAYDDEWHDDNRNLLYDRIENFGFFEDVSEEKPGFLDVVAFSLNSPEITHAGIVLWPDTNKFIHAMERVGVIISRLDSVYWSSTLKKVYRVRWAE